MLCFDQFEIAPGWRLQGEVRRGAVTLVPLAEAVLPEGYAERFLSDSLARRPGGELRLTEVPDASGRPSALHALPVETVRAFFGRFVGFVLADGGLLDDLTVRENLLLPWHYHDTGLSSSAGAEQELAERLHVLAGADAGAAELDLLPTELPAWRRRYWGWLRTLARQPRLVIGSSPLAGLPAGPRAQISALIARHRLFTPDAALLFFVTEPGEHWAWTGPGTRELTLQGPPNP